MTVWCIYIDFGGDRVDLVGIYDSYNKAVAREVELTNQGYAACIEEGEVE